MSYNSFLAESPLGVDLEDQRQRLPFLALLLFMGLYFMRPWDQLPALAALHPMMLMTIVTVALFLRTRPRIEFLAHRPMRLLLALLLIMLVSVLFSYWPSKSLTATIDYIKQIAFFVLIVHLVTSVDRLRQLSLVMTACCAVHGGLAIVNYASGGEARLEGVADGYFGDPNDLALSMILVLPLAWWLASTQVAKLPKLAVYGCMLLMVGGVFATQSRGGLMALLAAVAVMVITHGRERIGTFLLVMAAAVIFAVFVLPSDVFDRYSTITEYQKDESAMTRIAMWKAGARMFADHFMTGTGADTFEIVYGKSYIDRQFGGNTWRAAHNSYIQIAAELGFLGIGMWLAILASGFLSLWESRSWLAKLDHQASDEANLYKAQLRDLSSALLASLTSFLVGAFFLSRGYDLLLIILLAYIAILSLNVKTIAALESCD